MPKTGPDEEVLNKLRSVLAEHPEGIWIRELARKSGVSKSAVHMYLHTTLKDQVEEVMSVSGLVKLFRLKKGVPVVQKEEPKKIKVSAPKDLKMRTDIDYGKLGLKCGIEIHQQLDTKEKLFCSCKTSFSDTSQTAVSRKLRPVAGEMGDIDVAALHETLQKKNFHYQTYPLESCLVELDSEPPHPLNREALGTALEIALLLHCEVPDEIHTMRKTIIDGSNTSGFQRTTQIGFNGYLETSFGKVGIENISLEEDSSQILERGESSTTFGLNRLGIPLVEIGTASDVKTPEQAKEVAEKLGMVLRSTGKVRRGLGTIRQDVNISIREGVRNELKGVQELRLIPKIVENEVVRQQGIVTSGEKVSKDVRKVVPDATTEFLRPLPGAARLYPETDIPPVIITDHYLEEIKKHLPEMLEDKQARLVKQYQLGDELVKQLVKSGKAGLFEDMVKKETDAKMVAMLLSRGLKDLKTRENVPVENITDDHLRELFTRLGKTSLSKEALFELVKKIAADPGQDIAALVAELQKGAVSDEDIRKEIRKIVSEKKDLSFGALMGMVMKVLKGKADGKTIARILNEELKRSGTHDGGN